MKTVIISALIAASVLVLSNSGELQPPEFEVPHKWELLQEASVKLRNTITENVKILKALVLNDNAEVGQTIAERIDEAYLECMAIMDIMDAEIQAKTLTRDIFDKFFKEIHDAYHYKIHGLADYFQQLSSLIRERYLAAETKFVVALWTQAVDIRVLLIGD